MSVLVYTESEKGNYKKSAFEVASYAKEVADKMGIEVTAISFHADESETLEQYGVSKVLNVTDPALETFNAKAYAAAVAEAAKSEDASVIVISSSTDAKYMAGILAGELNAGYATNVVTGPESTSPLVVKRTAFTNKGFMYTQLNAALNIVGVSSNAYGTRENPVSGKVEGFSPTINNDHFGTKSVEIDQVVGKATIADADIVVSAGRGLKGPENWGIIEELADVLGAATACSKPVSDLGWRPHGEHVGQTGKPVASNLYIAIGISGAIQHLAGVSASKVKVVINTDPEAPFFKAADYGIVGDAFEVVPKLTEKLKEFKAQNA